MQEDDVLWAQVAGRNAEAFEKFYNNHYPRGAASGGSI